MGLNVTDAYDYVKKCRPQIAPNIAFMGQLLEYQKIINGETQMDKPTKPEKTKIEPQKILPPVVEKDTTKQADNTGKPKTSINGQPSFWLNGQPKLLV